MSRNFARNFKKYPDHVWEQIGKQLCPADQVILKKAEENGTYPVFVQHAQEAFRYGVEGHVADIRLIAGRWDIPFEEIKCPLFIWHGEEDTLSPIVGAKAMANWLPTARLNSCPIMGTY